jgi:hypothetical protein
VSKFIATLKITSDQSQRIQALNQYYNGYRIAHKVVKVGSGYLILGPWPEYDPSAFSITYILRDKDMMYHYESDYVFLTQSVINDYMKRSNTSTDWYSQEHGLDKYYALLEGEILS